MKPQTLELIAQRVADLVVERLADAVEAGPGGPLLTADQVADRFNVDRSWVYAHGDELGAIRIGDGDRPRLRFDPARVADALIARPSPATEPRRTSRPRPRSTDLLPVRGEA